MILTADGGRESPTFISVRHDMGFSASGDNKCYPLCYLAGGMPSMAVPPAGPVNTTSKDVFGVANAAGAQRKVGLCT